MTADLISLGVYGRRKQMKDQVSPFKVAMLVVIEEHCKMIGDRSNEINTFGKQEENPYTDAEECTLMITMLQIVQGPDLELIDLRQKLQAVAKPALLTAMTNRLKELCNDGVHVLFDLMQTIPVNLVTGVPSAPLHKTSILGLFVRRVCLAFEKLSFYHVTKLYNRFCVKYREALNESQQIQGIEDTSSFGDKSMRLMEMVEDKEEENGKKALDSVDVGKYSQRQAEYFIAQQAFLLNHNELKALSPVELQKKIRELLHSNPDFAEAHFLSYMNYLRINEYCGALNSLYEYFDRCQTLPTPATGSARSKTTTIEEDSHLRNHRYAALNIAAVEYRFGHRKEAIAAVQEAIKLAQESNDSVCLQHALVWLHRLGIHNEGGVTFMLDKLVTASGELSLWCVLSLGIQSLVRHSMLSCVQPSSVFEFLIKSDIVNTQHSLSDLTTVGFAQKASLWTAYGFSEMCLINSQLMLHLTAQESSVNHNAEPECLALCHIARFHADQGLYSMAYEILGAAKSRFPPSSQFSALWIQCEQQLNFDLALLRGKQGQAEKAISSLATVNTLEASYCRCLAMIDRGEGGRALQLIENLMEECREVEGTTNPLTNLTIRLLWLKGNILCSRGDATLSIHPLIEAINISRRSYLAHMTAIGILHLAFAQYCLGMPKQAEGLIEESFVSIMSHGSTFDRERTKFLLVRCQVASARNEPTTERQRVLSLACEKLTLITEALKRLEANRRVKEVLYFKCRILHELNQTAERNRCALEFRQLDERYPTWHELTFGLL